MNDTSILMLSNGRKCKPLIDWLAATMQAEVAKYSILRGDNENMMQVF